MKHLSLLCTFFVLSVQFALAQLPNGSIAPNWTMSDLNGVSHTLYDYLDQDKVVFLDFSATWCPPCWNYHHSGAFENLYINYGPGGTNDVMVFMIEGDASTNTACLYGPTGCVGGTMGNWVAGTPYPIIDNASQTGPYNINYWPTIYGVCPDRTITEVGQQGTAALWNFAQGCPSVPPTASTLNVVNVSCNGQSTGAIYISAAGNFGPFTYNWSNGATTQNLVNVPAGSYSVTVTGSNGGSTTLGPVVVSQPATPVTANLANVSPAGCGFGGSAEISASGGTGTLSYLWNNGATSSAIFNAPPGNYSATVTDQNGCTATVSNITINPATPPAAVASAPVNLNCNNATVTLSGTGTSTGPEYTYVWTTSNGNIVSGATTLNNCVVDQPGTYTLEVFNVNTLCTSSASTSVSQNTTAPTASAGSPAQINCNTSQVTLSGSGSTGSNFSILWTTQGGNIVSGATTLTPVVNAGGTYTLTITNTTNGCTTAASTTVTANTAAPNVSASGGELNCTNNSVTLNGNSTTQGVTYAWTGPNNFNSNQASPATSAAGTYTLTVTNSANGCTSSATAEVVSNTTQPQASAAGGTLTCTNSAVTLAGNSTTAGVTYAWTGPNSFSSNEQNPEVTTNGNYVLTVTAPNGCTKTATAVVNQNITQPTANAGPNGLLNCNATSATLNGTGSSSGSQFSYEWTTSGGNISAGGNTLTPTVNAAGTYTLTVSNSNNGCTSTSSTEVTQTPAVTAAISAQTNVNCFGTSTGSATVTPSGGNGTFTYAWSNGGNTATASNLSAGTYTVTVTDGENCAATKTVTITQPNDLVVNASSTAQTAPGVNDGTASAAVSGGTGSYTYNWSNGETTATITGLAPGNFTVTVTDENGCTETKTVTVNAFGCAVSADVSGTDVTCNGAEDGIAAISLNNAAEPLEFLWSNDETTAEITGLAPGTYSVTASDDNGCEVVASIEIEEPSALNANATTTAVTAAGASNGTATANPTGGNGPFTYLWSNGETTATITGLPSANYTVTVTDANGCEAQQTVPVAPFACGTVANISASNVSCNGLNNGQATATLNGGLSPFSYLWSNDETTATITGLTPGTYIVTINDAVNCAAIAEVTIDEPEALEFEIETLVNATCGEEDGMASVIATGGSAGYAYAWSNGETTASVENLAPGTYTVSVTDANDCAATLEVEIDVDDNEAPVVLTQNITLALGTTGTATLTPAQVNNGSSDNCGIAAITLDQTSFNCNDLGQQEVTLTVEDEAGNVASAQATVTVVDNIQPVIAVQNVVISLDENGTATITPGMIDNGSSDNCGIVDMSLDLTTFTCDDLGDQAVVLSVKDASGNSAAGTAIVTVQDNIAPAIECPESVVLPYCEPVFVFEITASDNCAENLTPNLVSGLPSGSAFPDGETVMTFEVNDGHGNHNTCSFTVTVQETMEVSLTVTTIDCHGENSGALAASASGGAGAYTYLWNNGATTPSIENLGPGVYSLQVTDDAGCSETTAFTLTEPAALSLAIDDIQPETGSAQNGAIYVTASGGVAPYSFEWTNESGAVISSEEDLTGLSAGTYTLSMEDANGCLSTHVFTVQSITGAISRELEEHITLFPNPTSGHFILALDHGTANDVEVTVYNVNGQLAAHFPQAGLASGKMTFDLSAQPAGFYLVKILIENQVAVKRLVISR